MAKRRILVSGFSWLQDGTIATFTKGACLLVVLKSFLYFLPVKLDNAIGVITIEPGS